MYRDAVGSINELHERKGSAMKHLDRTDNPAYFFDVCASIEGLCAELYHFYSDLFVANPEASILWEKTAQEEENHQKQFELANRIRDDITYDINIDIDRICQIHQKLGTLLKNAHESPPDLVTALIRAIDMEESLADLHLDSSVRFQDESLRKLFQAFREFDIDHVKSLKHCLAITTLSQTEMTG